jgi:hypothetical protein
MRGYTREVEKLEGTEYLNFINSIKSPANQSGTFLLHHAVYTIFEHI